MGDTTSDAELFAEYKPTEIIPIGSGYDFRCYTQHGPYFLCKDGLPLRDSSEWNTQGWRVCAAEMGQEEAIKKFAETFAAKDARIAEMEADRDRTWRRLAAAMREVSVGSASQVFDLAESALKHWRKLMDDQRADGEMAVETAQDARGADEGNIPLSSANHS
jgi:hypothetical protein